MKIQAQVVLPKTRSVFPAEIAFSKGVIQSISPIDQAPEVYLMPGFIDSHIHIESSMLTPVEFARKAVAHGTIATVSDPHEIANVLGIAGVDYMLNNSEQTPFKFHFGAPSCVPATAMETAGAVINSVQLAELMSRDSIYYLSEMMNYPGVLFQDEEVMAKITAAHRIGKPVDGHAPGLVGEELTRYIAAGITTDHEAYTYEEGLEKLQKGMKIILREGSAAKNFEALYPLIDEFPGQVMLCSDDKHPDDLLLGHINQLVARAVAKGCDLFNVLMAACIVPIDHYKMRVGMLEVGDPADFILVKNLETFEVQATYIDGVLVAENGTSNLPSHPTELPNRFAISELAEDEFQSEALVEGQLIRVIQVNDGQLITAEKQVVVSQELAQTGYDLTQDILKIAVVNRYKQSKPAVAYIHGFGLKSGAIASTVAHDSHNIICVGTSDQAVTAAVNALVEAQGGVVAWDTDNSAILELPIAGLMSPASCEEVGARYQEVDQLAKAMGCPLKAPFMSLSFMALLVIPELKLSDLGLFSSIPFGFVPLKV